MSVAVSRITTGCLLLCNETFSSTAYGEDVYERVFGYDPPRWYVRGRAAPISPEEARLLPVTDSEPGAQGANRCLGPARIYLARHGRTALNAAGALRGHINVPLDSVGQQQVSRLGAALAGKKPRLVISSPLLRAVQTAEAIANCAGAGTWVDDRLTDRYYGEWAGARVEDIVARWGSLDAAPGVEPAEEVRDRALAALTDIAQTAGGVATVVVSHDAVNRIALAALGSSLGAPADLPQDTGCFNTIEYEVQEDGAVKFRVLSVNEVVHVNDPPAAVTDGDK